MHSRLQLSLFAPGFGQYAMSPLYLAVSVRCLVCGAMLVRQWIHVRVYSGFWKYLQFLRDWVDSAPEVDSRNAPIARFPWKSVHYFMSLLYLPLSSQSIFCASRFFGALEHSQV